MGTALQASLIAVDLGNSRIKFGWYNDAATLPLPSPVSALDLPTHPWDLGPLEAWLAQAACGTCRSDNKRPQWVLASVNRPAAQLLRRWIKGRSNRAQIIELRSTDIPIAVAVPAPDRVGVDRLLAAWAVNRLRAAARPAIAIDVGTAITVDLVSATGTFLGGAILPGIAMSALALAQQTDLLPHIPFDELLDPPPPVGVSTETAIRSGLYWGAIGAMRELAARFATQQAGSPQMFVTGGAGPAVAELLGPEARPVPHLVLNGIAGSHAEIHSL